MQPTKAPRACRRAQALRPPWVGDDVIARIDFVDKPVNPVTLVNRVIPVILVNNVISQLPRKRLVQQRLLQRLQRGVLPLVEAGEALGFGGQGVKSVGNVFLFS